MSRLAKAAHQLLRGAAGDQRRGAGGAQQAFARKIVGVGVAGAFAGDDADAAAYADALAGGLDQGFVDAERGRGDRFKIKVGVLAAGGKRLAQAAFHQAFRQAKFLDEIAFVVGCGYGHLD